MKSPCCPGVSVSLLNFWGLWDGLAVCVHLSPTPIVARQRAFCLCPPNFSFSYAVLVVSKESTWLVLPTTSCQILYFEVCAPLTLFCLLNPVLSLCILCSVHYGSISTRVHVHGCREMQDCLLSFLLEIMALNEDKVSSLDFYGLYKPTRWIFL
jgi:hypothetical protein